MNTYHKHLLKLRAEAKKAKPKPKNKRTTPRGWKLVFWVHGTWEGDDLCYEVKFVKKPTKDLIEKVMWWVYKKQCEDPEGVFQNMKNDYGLVRL